MPTPGHDLLTVLFFGGAALLVIGYGGILWGAW